MKTNFILFLCILFISSCVSKKEYDSLLDKYMQTQVDKNNIDKNLTQVQSDAEANKLMLSQAIDKLKTDSINLSELIENMKNDLEGTSRKGKARCRTSTKIKKCAE
ncbi:MAG: hypothetical protein IPK18_03890 [Sphingobacteriales bacterium]|nr:MAG: hypothetical protein IPK18_03890 [Sphingobacteriales bacterium]